MINPDERYYADISRKKRNFNALPTLGIIKKYRRFREAAGQIILRCSQQPRLCCSMMAELILNLLIQKIPDCLF